MRKKELRYADVKSGITTPINFQSFLMDQKKNSSSNCREFKLEGQHRKS